MAEQSIRDQTAIEEADSVNFETYLSDYYQQYQNCGES
jgi:glutamate--cysteine ligase